MIVFGFHNRAYKMALCISHSHSIICGQSILIRFTHLTDIYLDINWLKVQQNVPCHFVEILFFFI